MAINKSVGKLVFSKLVVRNLVVNNTTTMVYHNLIKVVNILIKGVDKPKNTFNNN